MAALYNALSRCTSAAGTICRRASQGGAEIASCTREIHSPSRAAQSRKLSAYTAPERWLCRSAPFGIPRRNMFSITGSSRMRSKCEAVRASAVSAPEVDWSAVCTGGMTQPPRMAVAVRSSRSLIKGMEKRHGIPCNTGSITCRFDQQLAEPGLRRLARRAAVPGHRHGCGEIDRQWHDLDLGGSGDLPGGALRHRGDEIGCRECNRQRQIGRDQE